MKFGGFLKVLRGRRLGLGPKIHAGLGVGVALMLVASVVALLSFRAVRDAQRRIIDESMPSLTAAIRAAQQGSALVNAAPRLVSASSNEELEALKASILIDKGLLYNLIDELQKIKALEDQAGALRSISDDLSATLDNLESSTLRRREMERRLEALEEEIPVMTRQVDHILVPEIDDQTFYIATGHRELGDRSVLSRFAAPFAVRASYEELLRYRNLLTLHTQANLAARLLAEAAVVNDRDLIQPLRERYNAAIGSFDRAFRSAHRPALRRLLGLEFARLKALGDDSNGIFVLQENILKAAELEEQYVEENRAAATRLLDAMDRVVTGTDILASEASRASESAVNTGMLLLLVLNVINITVGILMGWLFVGRHLVRRLTGLAAAMRSMADGNLEVPVKVRGNDEVTDMADALEVFRRHALEVQRLNLVEKLADELQEKNQELEKTLVDLEKAQDQVIVQEKLASLGQLTAGIAHEIKNPLNFVNNFSEVSGELIEEVREVLTEAGDVLPEEAREEIGEILNDLTGNLEKIQQHGGRADGIVRSMLEHSRGESGERRPVDMNGMVKQYAALAYHSMRAADQMFNVEWEEDFDPEVGEIEVIPQDMSRVFLNLLTNACQATAERFAKTDGGYEPHIRLSSRRLGDRAEFRVRDNGPGIPDDVVSKIFEPFVTTKATGEGTGLGLSLAQDIVAQHGGAIGVETEPGSFTEFWVTIPVESPGVGATTRAQ